MHRSSNEFSMLIVLLALSLILFVAAEAQACSCRAPDPPKDEFERTDAVFTGVVVSIKDTGDFQKVVKLRLLTVWKGPAVFVVEVLTGRDGVSCGFYFEVGTAYVIYAHQSDEGQLSTNICTRTNSTENAAEDLAFLEGLEPIFVPDDSGCCGGPLSAGDAIVAGGFFIFLFRRRG